mmetsp:Transcript_7882/g.21455  ORF Transcript_7882/g.21455 Transcript_7882/m.21455 type:complete len:88 (-) Transcript_7882:1169-1432(-)
MCFIISLFGAIVSDAQGGNVCFACPELLDEVVVARIMTGGSNAWGLIEFRLLQGWEGACERIDAPQARGRGVARRVHGRSWSRDVRH